MLLRPCLCMEFYVYSLCLTRVLCLSFYVYRFMFIFDVYSFYVLHVICFMFIFVRLYFYVYIIYMVGACWLEKASQEGCRGS